VNTTATNRKIRVLLTAIRNNTLIPRPEFQRRLVWSNKHKLAFIETVLLGYPFPEIYIAAGDVNPDTGEGTEMLVDGQQRMTTLDQYFKGSEDLRLSSEIRPYAELDEARKLAFLEYEVVVRDLGSKSIDAIKEVFERINSTKYSLNAMEIHNARFDGAFKCFAEAIAQHAFFDRNRVFKTTEVRRMSDTRFALTFIITAMSDYFNRDALLEEYLEKYNDDFNRQDELRKELDAVFAYIEKCDLGTNSRAWKKADLLTLLSETHRGLFKNGGIDPPTKVGKRLKRFYARVDNMDETEETDSEVRKYHRAALQATNDRSSRVSRGEVLRAVIKGAWAGG